MHHGEPLAGHAISARRTAPMPSSLVCPAERALRTARTNSVDPTETTATMIEYAQAGIFAVTRT